MVDSLPVNDDVNHRSLRELAALSDHEIHLLSEDVLKVKPRANMLTEKEMFVMIRSLPLTDDPEKDRIMKKEMDFGVKFLLMLLDREGPEAVINFAQKVGRVIREEEGLYEYDFDKSARDSLKAIRRRHFLKEFGVSTGWFLSGIGTTGVAGLHVLDDSLNGPSPDRSQVPPGPLLSARRRVRRVRLGADDGPSDGVELLIGALLMSEGIKGAGEKKDEQIDEISDTISELCKCYPELKKPSRLAANSPGGMAL